MKSSIRTTQKVAGKQSHRFAHRLKVAHIMELPEPEFGKMIHSIEKHPLYERYFSAENPHHRLFGHRRFPGTRFDSSFLELNESVATDAGTVDLQAFLEDKSEILQICRRIGQENFENFFLFNDGKHSLQEIAETCAITAEEVRKTMNLINDIAVQEQFATPSSTDNAALAWDKIGTLEKTDTNGLEIQYANLRYARGRYHIDYTRLAALRKENTLSRDEWNKLNDLIRQMELVNARKATVCMILDSILKRQKQYFLSQRKEQLEPFSQAELAKSLGLHSSTISRALARKTIIAPWREEIPLKDFLIKGIEFRVKALMESLFQQEQSDFDAGTRTLALRDEEIRDHLRQALGIRIATRTVAKYRDELGVENVYRRPKPRSTERSESPKSLWSASDKPAIPKDPKARRSPSTSTLRSDKEK